MAQLYDPDGRFHDPAFGELTGAEAGDMWRMLTGRATDLEVELAEHEAKGDRGTAHWIATYTFRGGRHVVNDIHARFRFRDGRIDEHDDSFSFCRWARQALGPGRARSRAAADESAGSPPGSRGPGGVPSGGLAAGSLARRPSAGRAGQEEPDGEDAERSAPPPIQTIGSSIEKPSSLLPR